MSDSNDKYRKTCQRLLALCKRNITRLEEMDRRIVQAEISRFYSSGDRGQKTGKTI